MRPQRIRLRGRAEWIVTDGLYCGSESRFKKLS